MLCEFLRYSFLVSKFKTTNFKVKQVPNCIFPFVLQDIFFFCADKHPLAPGGSWKDFDGNVHTHWSELDTESDGEGKKGEQNF